MNEIKLLSVFVENKPGFLSKATKALADAGVNILWFKIIDATSDKFGVVRLLVDKQEAGLAALKHHGLAVSTVPALAVVADDNPGTLAKLLEALAAKNVDIQNGSGYYFKGRTVLMLETAQMEKAATVLESLGYELLKSE